MMNEHRMKLAVPMLAVLLLMLAAPAIVSDGSDAAGEDLSGYGKVNEIPLAPGYTWSYTASFPEDLSPGIALSFQVNDLGDVATINDHTVRIGTIPSSMAQQKFNLVLKAHHQESDQTAYQWIRISVNPALSADYSGCVNQIIEGSSQDITLSFSGGVDAVAWTSVSMPDGMTLEGNRVHGTPTAIGENTIKLTATSSFESKDLTITFTVYNRIAEGDDESIAAIGGKTVASSAVAQAGGDLGVVWTAGAELPAGLTLDTATGAVSGIYTGREAGQVTVTLTGTAANGPAQTTTRNLTISYEPAISITGGGSGIVTYTGNTEPRTAALAIEGEHSDITWSVPETAGISIAQDGTLTITGAAAVTESGSIEVTARTAYGQTAVHTVEYTVEDILTVSGDNALASVGGHSKAIVLTIAGGSGNTCSLSTGTYGDAVAFDPSSGRLSVSTPAKHDMETVTLTVTSLGGQTAVHTVDVTVFSPLGFDSMPTSAGIVGYAG